MEEEASDYNQNYVSNYLEKQEGSNFQFQYQNDDLEAALKSHSQSHFNKI